MAVARKVAIGLLCLLVVLCSITAGREFERAHSAAQASCTGVVCASVRHTLVHIHRTAAFRDLAIDVAGLAAIAVIAVWHRHDARKRTVAGPHVPS